MASSPPGLSFSTPEKGHQLQRIIQQEMKVSSHPPASYYLSQGSSPYADKSSAAGYSSRLIHPDASPYSTMPSGPLTTSPPRPQLCLDLIQLLLTFLQPPILRIQPLSPSPPAPSSHNKPSAAAGYSSRPIDPYSPHTAPLSLSSSSLLARPSSSSILSKLRFRR